MAAKTKRNLFKRRRVIWNTSIYLILSLTFAMLTLYAVQGRRAGKQWIRDAILLAERIADGRTLPAHNISAKHIEWTSSVSDLENRIQKLSPWDRRRAREFLGCLYASLDDSEPALNHLSRAGSWDSLSRKAALTYVTLLTEALIEEQIAIALPAPAPLSGVPRGHAGGFAASWKALVEGRFDEAIHLVRQLQEGGDSPLGMLRLEARFYTLRGIARHAGNRPEEALLDFRLSLIAEEQLQRAFPSDRRTYLAQAGIYTRMMTVETEHTDHQISAYLSKALALCSIAAFIQPEDCSVAHMRAGLHQAMVRHIEKHEGDAAYHRGQVQHYNEEASRKCGGGSSVASVSSSGKDRVATSL
jgi:hypothetical protein